VIYEGLWFSPIMDALKAFVEETQKFVTGTIRVKLFKGHATVVGRKSAHSLYDMNLATYGEEDTFDHKAALGFIQLYGMPTKVYSQVNRDHIDSTPKAVIIDKKEAVKQ